MFKQIFAAFLGAMVSLACLVPPILHFVTGPLGPFIGGFIGGLIYSYNKRAKYVIGLTLGFILAAITNLIGFLINNFGWTFFDYLSKNHLAQFFDTTTVLKFSIVVFLYSSILAITGVYTASRLKKFVE